MRRTGMTDKIARKVLHDLMKQGRVRWRFAWCGDDDGYTRRYHRPEQP